MRRHVACLLLPWLVVSVACGGRTDLALGLLSSEGGDEGTPADGGTPSSGGAAGSGSFGGRPSGGAGAAGSAGSAGSVGAMAGSSGSGGSAPLMCEPGTARCGDECIELRTDPLHCGSCVNDCGAQTSCIDGECACQAPSLVLLSHVPRNGTVGIAASSTIRAELNCAFDPTRVNGGDARLYGSFAGPISVSFPKPSSPRELLLQPAAHAGQAAAYLPGERVTAWLGANLGTSELPFQPYSWQFIAEVSPASPGKFVATMPTLPSIHHGNAMVLGDIDEDGDLDVIVRGDAPLLLLRNHGDATFEDAEELGTSGVPVLGDVDGDGDLDIADGQRLLLNDGQGHFLAGPAAPGCIALGDVDGDGDLDCLANVGYTKQNELLGHVLFNSGDGSMQQGGDAPIGFQCQLWDLDADGDLDAVCVSPVVTGATVLMNDGKGNFTATAQQLSQAGARAIALGDVDADGDIDVVVSQWFGGGKTVANQLYLNDGSGRFDTGEVVGSDGGDVALADIDGDGDLDLVYSHLTPYGPYSGPFDPSPILLNDGEGHFALSQQTLGEPAFQWFELGDLDGDRDLDAFVFHQVGVTGSYGSVWLNQN